MAAPVATILVEIDGETSGLARSVDSATTDLTRLDLAQRNVARSSTATTTQLNELTGGIDDMPASVRRLNNRFDDLSNRAANVGEKAGSLLSGVDNLSLAMAGGAGLAAAISAVVIGIQVLPRLFGEAEQEARDFASAARGMIDITDDLSDVKFGFDTEEARELLDVLEAEIELLDESLFNVRVSATGAGLAITNATTGDISNQEELKEILEAQLNLVEARLRVQTRLNRQAREELLQPLPSHAPSFIRPITGGPPVPAVQVQLPEGFLETRLDRDIVGAAAAEFAALPFEERFRVDLLQGRAGELPTSAELAEVPQALKLELDELAAGPLLDTKTEFDELAELLSEDFNDALADLVAGLILFGDTLGDTLKNFGRRAAGGLLQGAFGFALNAIPGGGLFGGLAQGLASTFGLKLNLGDLEIAGTRERVNSNESLINQSFESFLIGGD